MTDIEHFLGKVS